MGAGASASGGGGGGWKGKVKVKQGKKDVDVDPIADALVPPGWMRVLRGDNIEGFVRAEQMKHAHKLPGYYAERAVAWHLSLADAQGDKEAMGIVPKGSGLIGLEVTPINPNDPLQRQYARFLSEVSPRVEGLEPSLMLRADEASITDPEEQRPDEFWAIEAWIRVSAKPSAMDGLLQSGAMAATAVEIAAANKPWPIPCLLEPVPEPQPPLERSAEDLLNSATTKFEAGDPAGALQEYKEAAKAAQLNLYMLRTRKQLLLGNGTGAAFRKSRDMMDRSIHHAQELTLWRAVIDEEDWIQMENDLWLPKLALVLISTPLDQMVIRAMATAGWIAAALALDDFEEATAGYEEFGHGRKLHSFIERRPVARALAAYELHKPQPKFDYDETWYHYRAVRDHTARHAEDLELQRGDVVAVASSGRHETGWWEGFLPTGAYGLLPCHAVEPLAATDVSAQQLHTWRPIRYPNRVHFVTPMSNGVASKGRRPVASETFPLPQSPPSDGMHARRGTLNTRSANDLRDTEIVWKTATGTPTVDLRTALVRSRVAEPLLCLPRRRGARQKVISQQSPWPYKTTHIPETGQSGVNLINWPPRKGQIDDPGNPERAASPVDDINRGASGEDVVDARFTDPDFLAAATSLAGGWEDGGDTGGRWLCNPPLGHDMEARYKSIEWARSSLLRADTSKPERAVLNKLSRSLPLFHPRNAVTGKGTALPSDVIAGETESAFLSVLVVLARRTPIRIERLIKNLGRGRYVVRFQDFGRDCIIDVDEFLPCVRQRTEGASSGELLEGGALVPVFAQITSGVLWPALIEKAWAKYYRIGITAGSYHTVTGAISDPGDALTALTGAPVEYQNCDPARKSSGVAEQLWQKVRTSLDKDYLVCAGTGGSRQSHADELKLMGLEPLRAYAIAAAVQVNIRSDKTQRLIQLRSPSHDTAWQGDWGPESDLWTSAIRAEMTGKCDTGAEKGCFWMAWDDFCNQFHGIYICLCRADWERSADRACIPLQAPRLQPDLMYSLGKDADEFDDEVKAAQESATKLHVGTSWTAVAYFHITIPPGSRRASRKSLIAVSQRDLRAVLGNSYAAIEFRVLGGSRQQLGTQGHKLIGRSDCRVDKEVWLECELESDAEYMVVVEVAGCTKIASAKYDVRENGQTAKTIELMASCWRESDQNHLNGPALEHGDEETDLDAADEPMKSSTKSTWMPECGSGGSSAELAAGLWGVRSDISVRAMSSHDAWDRLSRWYSTRIAKLAGDGQAYDLRKEGDTVGLPHWFEWVCEEEKVLVLRYVNKSGSVVIREALQWRLGGMRVVGESTSVRSSSHQTGVDAKSVDVVVGPGEEALLIVQGCVLGMPTAHEYDRATTLDFLETNI